MNIVILFFDLKKNPKIFQNLTMNIIQSYFLGFHHSHELFGIRILGLFFFKFSISWNEESFVESTRNYAINEVSAKSIILLIFFLFLINIIYGEFFSENLLSYFKNLALISHAAFSLYASSMAGNRILFRWIKNKNEKTRNFAYVFQLHRKSN